MTLLSPLPVYNPPVHKHELVKSREECKEVIG